MKRWLSNLGSAALALVLAVLVWVVAVREEYPRAQFTQPIPVNRTGLPENLGVFGDTLSDVRIEIRAPKAALAEPEGARFQRLDRSCGVAVGRIRCAGASITA